MITLSIVQFNPVWGNKPYNLQLIASLLQNIKADLIVLPELCTTGYSFLNHQEALTEGEDENGEGVALLRKLAIGQQAMIIAGFAEKNENQTYNAALVALPDNTFQIYRKTHLFYKETLCFEPGNSGFFVVDHPLVDCKVGVMVCNDWRYPEAARSLALLGADIIACPSNLVSSLWGVGMPARALENKVYLAVANRGGTEMRLLEDGTKQTLTFNGGSVLYDFNGAPLVKAEKDECTVLTVQIDVQLTRDKSFNAYNNLFADRRPDMYYSNTVD
jgi:predicted amidohydrolase